MIKVNTSHIGPDGLALEGEENSSLLELSDVRTGAAAGPIKYNFLCTMAGRDLLVRGTLKLSLKAECGRCLKALDTEIKIKEACHHYENVAEREVDLTADVREDILVALPTTFLCSEECKGLCPHCGADLNEGACKCKPEKEESSEPSAWEALSDLKIEKPRKSSKPKKS